MAVGSGATSEAGAGTVDGASVAPHPARTSTNGAKLANGHRNLQFGGQDYRSHVQGVVIMVQNGVGEQARAQLGAPLRQGEQR